LAIAALAALLAIGAPDPGAGQDAAARPAPAFRSAAPARHVVDADDGHPLTVWEKRGAGAGAGGVVLLLHGRTWSSLPDFDLQVPGEDLSLMDALAEAGYAVYALDARGYGDTPRDDTGWLTPDRMARDVAGVLGWIAGREDAAARPALFGWSQQPVVVF
jgi:alpha-beta hydrolase superfamily lysophospholipase